MADFVTSYSPDRDNDAYNRVDVREAGSVDLRAAVDPRADAVAVIAFEATWTTRSSPDRAAKPSAGPRPR